MSSENYELEAEAFALHYESELKPVKALLLMSGILCRLESDLIQYERKNGKSARLTESLERIELLKSIYEDFSVINERNKRLKILIASNNARMLELETENEKLSKELEGVQKAWQQI